LYEAEVVLKLKFQNNSNRKTKTIILWRQAMKGSIGCPARIVTPAPHMREPARGTERELSEQAKFRLKVFDWYRNSSPCFSFSGKPEAGLTCRRFGIHCSYFYQWKKRYEPKRLSSLENKRTAPKRKREPGYSRDLVRAIWEAEPSYSTKKIRPILLRERASVPSVSTLGRLIVRENLFFRPNPQTA
jgi:transposase